jgi:hypothetical protein
MAAQKGLTFRDPVPEDQPAVLAVLGRGPGAPAVRAVLRAQPDARAHQGAVDHLAVQQRLLPLPPADGLRGRARPRSFDGRPVHPDYDGPGLDRVLFTRAI